MALQMNNTHDVIARNAFTKSQINTINRYRFSLTLSHSAYTRRSGRQDLYVIVFDPTAGNRDTIRASPRAHLPTGFGIIHCRIDAKAAVTRTKKRKTNRNPKNSNVKYAVVVLYCNGYDEIANDDFRLFFFCFSLRPRAYRSVRTCEMYATSR